MLSDILTVNATLVNQAQNEEIKALSESTYNQNEQVKRISAWAAILFAPTLIGTVYGMNFSNMPGLGEGFALSVGLMLGSASCYSSSSSDGAGSDQMCNVCA